jgi:membrane protease YdiL (CAAX protease family)
MKVLRSLREFGVLSIFLLIYLIYLIYIVFVSKLGYNLITFKAGIMYMAGIVLCYIAIEILFRKYKTEIEIPSNKKAIYPFLIVYVVLTIMGSIGVKYHWWNKNDRSLLWYVGIFSFYAFFIAFLFISHFWGITIKTFHFNLTKKSFLYMSILFLITYLPKCISKTTYIYINYDNKFLQNIVQILIHSGITFIYPAFFEEYLYRGLLVTGLQGLGFNKLKTNLIQSILFGILHYNYYTNLGVFCFVPTVAQMMAGFIFCKLYYKTKSLAPGIIFHALWDVL